MKHPTGAPRHPESPDAAIARRAAMQHGVFTREQALHLGASRRVIGKRLTSGQWERLHPSVYRLTGAGASWRQALMAACLWAREGAVVSHRSAAALHGLPAGASGIEITLSEARRCQERGIVAHRSGRLPAVDGTVVDGIPVTTVARTIIDLAAVLPPRQLEENLDYALSLGLVPRVRLMWRLRELATRGRPGIQVLRRLLDARDPGARVPASILESRLGAILVVPGMPKPVWGHEVKLGGRWRVLDCSYPDLRLVVEVDGWENHCGRAQAEEDMARQNLLVEAGWTVLRFPWSQVEHHSATVVRAVFGST